MNQLLVKGCRHVVAHAFDEKEFGACDVIGRITATARRNHGVIAAMHHQRRRHDAGQQMPQAARGGDGGDLSCHAARALSPHAFGLQHRTMHKLVKREPCAGDAPCECHAVRQERGFFDARVRGGTHQHRHHIGRSRRQAGVTGAET